MLSNLLNEKTIIINEQNLSWEESILKAGKPLLEAGSITQNYLDSIISMHHQLGPYYVIAPHIAMPHSRSENGALKLGLSILISKKDITFNSLENDPIHFVFLFSAPDNQSHLEMLMSLSELFSNQEDLDAIQNSNSIEQVLSIINQY